MIESLLVKSKYQIFHKESLYLIVSMSPSVHLISLLTAHGIKIDDLVNDVPNRHTVV